MIRYRYALDADGRLADARELVGTPRGLAYTCVACERPLVARVNGERVRPHFAHKAVGECGRETYLHRLAKLAFAETYRRMAAAGDPFEIRLTAPSRCDRLSPWLPVGCRIGQTEQVYDLTAYYSEVRVEKRHGEFVPDVSLHSVDHPDRDPVLVEVAVTHFLSEKKERSGGRIIEIPVESEEDVEPIRAGRLDESNAKFLGFAPEVAAVPDADCRCLDRKMLLFLVHRNGKCWMEPGTLRQHHAKVYNRSRPVAWCDLIPLEDSEGEHTGVLRLDRGFLFVREVKKAAADGAPVKNCHLCRYVGRLWEERKNCSVYCKTYRKPCNSNAAADCDRFRPALAK